MRGGISKPIYMNNVDCDENELTLMDCSYEQMNDTNKNDHSKDVAIKCSQGRFSYNKYINYDITSLK